MCIAMSESVLCFSLFVCCYCATIFIRDIFLGKNSEDGFIPLQMKEEDEINFKCIGIVGLVSNLLNSTSKIIFTHAYCQSYVILKRRKARH